VLDYYRGLDSTFFGNRLPLWVCHKDPQDFIVHEDQTPWLNTKSVEAPRDYNYDFTNEGQRSFYESDTLAEPLYNWTWWFFLGTSLYLLIFAFITLWRPGRRRFFGVSRRN